MATRKTSKRKSRSTHPCQQQSAKSGDPYDVIIVGAGPAGSTLGWRLASARASRRSSWTARASLARKSAVTISNLAVCACWTRWDACRPWKQTSPLPIIYSSTYVDAKRCYIGRIPFYGVHKYLPPHGYIVPRDVLDNVILETAVKAGANAHQETYVTGFSADRSGVTVEAIRHGDRVVYRGRMIVGADGVNSVVARHAGLLVDDPRHIALSQRAYADGYDGGIGEAAFFFDGDFFPGYGWMFPMSQGRVNLGVGVLKETCQRNGIAVPQLFRDFFEKLKRSHPRCRKLKLVRPPIGGIVKTYGGAGPQLLRQRLADRRRGKFCRSHDRRRHHACHGIGR